MQVTVLDVDQLELQEEDVVVMATDGLWDVLSNEQVARLVRSFLPGNQEDPHRYCSFWGPAWCQQQHQEVVMAEKTALMMSPAQGRWSEWGCLKLLWGVTVGLQNLWVWKSPQSNLWPCHTSNLPRSTAGLQ